MPIHSQIASKLRLLEGLTSFETATADPAERAELDEFMPITGAPLPPQVDTHGQTVDGPHGAVPVRIHRPADPGRGRPAPAWVHGGAFVGGDLQMPDADWTARQICERAGAVVVSVDHRPCTGGNLSIGAALTLRARTAGRRFSKGCAPRW